MLLVETLAAPSTTQARDLLLDSGFDNVTIVIAGRAGDMARSSAIPAAAA